MAVLDDGDDEHKLELADHTGSDATFDQIHDWIEKCKEHKHCTYLHRQPEEGEYVPTRLLYVGEPGAPSLRLVGTGNTNVQQYRPYVTLRQGCRLSSAHITADMDIATNGATIPAAYLNNTIGRPSWSRFRRNICQQRFVMP